MGMTRPSARTALLCLAGLALAVFGQGIIKGLETCASERLARCPGEME